MSSQWASQSERWHFAMRQSTAGSDAERLAEAIGAEIRAGTLPAGAVLPVAARLAIDLMVDESVVGSAYESLTSAGLLAVRFDRRVCVAGTPEGAPGALLAGATIVPFGRGRRSNQNPGEED
jgi:DNA-binding FadR family transcriptional regulator